MRITLEALEEKAEEAFSILRDCTICPRNCHVDRTKGQEGFCRTLERPFVSSWGAHFGEEPPLVGTGGSGTVFLGNCNLCCFFCQNWSISQRREGSYLSFEELAGIMLELQRQGCHNINLVSPSHQAPAILKSLAVAARSGLSVPVVYNTGGYDSVDTLKLLDGAVDIYMPDFKYWDPETANKFSAAPDYPDVARRALREMHRQVGVLEIENGVAVKGLLVRHLVLPGGLAGTPEVMRFIAREVSRGTYVNIMDQYYPCFKSYGFSPLDRRITKGEYESAIQAALDAGLGRLEGVTA